MTVKPSHRRLGGVTRLLAASALASLSWAAQAAGLEAESIRRGEYLATAADCVACHTAPGGKPFAGGLAISSPVGTIFSPNITPSATAGIGHYSKDAFARAVREGIRADGANLYPAMPYTSYRLFTDADIEDLYTYFKLGIAAVDTAPPRTALPFPMNIRLSMLGWNLIFLGKPGFVSDPSQSMAWNRGKYLVAGAAHCSTCHTPRGFLMEELSGRDLAGGQVGAWYAPNITSDPASGIGSWSEEELVRYLSTGSLPGKAQAAGSMGEAVEHSFSHLAPEDIAAIATYIRTVPAIHDPSDDKPRFTYGGASSELASLRGKNGIRSESNKDASGEELFQSNCASCHAAAGQGSKDGYYPSLFHNSASGAASANNLIATILNGVDRTTPAGQAFMPGFGGKPRDMAALDDTQVARLATYVVTSYGRPGKEVTPGDVAQVRSGGPGSPLVLVARLGIAFGSGTAALILALIYAHFRKRRRRP